ncbi:MAG: hypothetical protein Q8L29_00285 [archaeon]|nr:hypothetical protein [archaeon]
MKTIALSEKTFNILQRLKTAKKAGSFEEIVVELIVEKENIPKSLFGTLKKKTKPFTSENRKELWNDRI